MKVLNLVDSEKSEIDWSFNKLTRTQIRERINNLV